MTSLNAPLQSRQMNASDKECKDAARKPYLRYRNTHSSAKRVFQSSASPFGTGVKPCLHIKPAPLHFLISQYSLLDALLMLKQNGCWGAGKVWCDCRGV